MEACAGLHIRVGRRAVAAAGRVQNELSLLWGTEAYVHPPSSSTKEMLKACERVLLEVGAAQAGETVVMMAGRLSGLGLSSSVTIYTIGGEAPRDV